MFDNVKFIFKIEMNIISIVCCGGGGVFSVYVLEEKWGKRIRKVSFM